jgi:RimJ/RimL family protein N-acetyltransferase
MSPDVSVRPAELLDRYLLWLWANDEETRHASFHRDEVAWKDHVAWFARQIADGCHVLIGETAEAQPIGSIRFDTANGWRTTRLSYVVAPESRGRGWAQPLVRAGVAWLRVRRPEADIEATVLSSNLASLRVFRELAWEERGGDGVFEFSLHA